MTSAEIHASHVLFLNDSEEFLYAESMAKDQLFGSKAELHKTILEWLNRSYVFNDLRSVFVFSMSENSDQLSQWRAYCHPGDGYSIGFWVQELMSVVGKGFHLLQCTYDASRHDELIYLLLKDTEDNLEQNRGAGVKEQDLVQGAATFFMLGLFSLAGACQQE